MENNVIDQFMADWKDKLDLLRADDDGMPESQYQQTVKDHMEQSLISTAH